MLRPATRKRAHIAQKKNEVEASDETSVRQEVLDRFVSKETQRKYANPLNQLVFVLFWAVIVGAIPFYAQYDCSGAACVHDNACFRVCMFMQLAHFVFGFFAARFAMDKMYF